MTYMAPTLGIEYCNEKPSSFLLFIYMRETERIKIFSIQSITEKN